MKHPSTTPVELHPYPFPEGMAIPRLMPFQEYPWNGDHFIAEEVLRLKAAHGIKLVMETGTCLGTTSLWLSGNFDRVFTCEINHSYSAIANIRFREFPYGNVTLIEDDSVAVIGRTHNCGLYWLYSV